MHHSYNYYGERSFHIFLRSLYKTILSLINFKLPSNDLIGDLFIFLQDLEKDASSTKPREALAVLRPNRGTLSSFAGSVKKGGLRWAFDLFCIFVVFQ